MAKCGLKKHHHHAASEVVEVYAAGYYRDGKMQWHLTDREGSTLYLSDEVEWGSSVLAEFFAIVEALRRFKRVKVWTKSLVAREWIYKGRANSSRLTPEIIAMIEDAERFLARTRKPKIKYWRQSKRGEFPANF